MSQNFPAMSTSESWNPRCSVAEADTILCGPGSLLEVETRLIDGRVQRVWKNLWPSLRSLWLWAGKEHAQKTCIVFEGQRLTYHEALSLSLRCATLFRDLYRVEKGDRIAICSRNYASYFTVFWACHLLGAVSVLVNAHLPLDSLTHCLALTHCKVVVVDPERADLLEPHIKADVKLRESSFIVIECYEGKGRWNGMDDYAKLMSRHQGNLDSIVSEDPNVGPEDNATIIFTSGTTGLPKGVLSSQRAFLTNIFNVAASSGRDAIRRGVPFPPPPPPEGSPQRSALLSTPLFHVTATAVMLNATFLGYKIVSMRKWDGREGELIREENVVLLGAVPSVITDLAEYASPDEKSPVEVIIYGGAPVAEPLFNRARRVFPTASMGQGYGLTESNAGSVGFAGRDFELRPTSTGIALPTNDVLIMKDGVRAPVNVVGEVWLRGSNIMRGYWGDQDATDMVLTRDGWLKTGDLGSIDEEGFVYIKDRIKDIIIRGGENIPSVTVENALYAEPGVLEAATVGVPDARLGELVTALVTVKPGFTGTITEASLLRLARQALPRFAVPAMILVVPEERFDHTQSGKIIKRNLRDFAHGEWLKRCEEARATSGGKL